MYNREEKSEKQRIYNKINRKKIIEKQQSYNEGNKLEIARKQKIYDESNREKVNAKQKIYNQSNSEEIAEKQRIYNQINKEQIKDKQKHYNRKNRKQICDIQAARRNKKANLLTAEDRFLLFRQDVIDGPNYACQSCERILFKPGVKFITKKELDELLDKLPPKIQDALESIRAEEDVYLCHTCLKNIKSQKIPSICIANALSLEEIPEELKLTDLEQQLIAKVLIFMKVKKLPTTRMKAVIDKVISVPIENQDVEKTVRSLPRKPDDAQIVAVELKRKLEMKNSHLREFIRPECVVKAVKKLKALHNPYYKDVTVDEDFTIPSDDEIDDIELEEMKVDEDMDIRDELLNEDDLCKVLDESMKIENPETQEYDELLNEDDLCKILDELMEIDEPETQESDEDNDDNDMRLQAVKDYQADHDSHTCLMPIDLDAQVVVNEGKTAITRSRNDNGKGISIAPGEGKIPTNFLREENIDVKGFPRHFPSGINGIDHIREIRLTKQMYFNQRLLNKNERFSTDPYYVFMATSYIERLQLERQIDISGLKGISTESNGQTKLNLKDPCDVFKKLSGSPKFWQNARNELVAKVKQLGPFQVFFTFSCGEMRWAEVYISFFIKKGCKVEFICEEEWSGKDIDILVNGIPIWDFIENMPERRHELFKNHTFLLTRIFDARVKSFVKHILMGRGLDKIPFRYYSYRVEFQARGMPHIHGVAWIQKDWLASHNVPNVLSDDPEKALIIVENLIKCELPDDQEIRKIVKEVQQHNHTKSCMKYSGVCRYGFPRLPSPRNIVAQPLPKEMSKAEREKETKTALEILEKARNLIQSEKFDNNVSFENFLVQVGVKEDEYVKSLSISSKGNVLVLKRGLKEIHTNNYNTEMLKAWNANMDIQIALDPYAVITYVVSYVLKDETGMTKFLKDALNSQTGKSIKEKITALKNAYLLNRQVGESESCYRILAGMKLKDSNISTVFVQTGFPENRTEFYKKLPEGNHCNG